MSDAQREMTLEEWVYRLPEMHRARKEYEQLKANTRTPTPAEVEILVEELILSVRVEDCYPNSQQRISEIKSRLLATLSTTPHSSQDVPVEKMEANKKNLFLLTEACKLAYRKHHLGDESIGWDELSDVLHNVLYTVMDNGPYLDWLDSLQSRKAGE